MEVTQEYVIKLIETIESQAKVIEEQAKTIEKQAVIIKEQAKRIEALEFEVKSLKAQLSKNSNNSSIPPSKNKFGTRHRNNNKKDSKNNKKVGGQEGHKGKNLQISDEVTEKKVHLPDNCEKCGEPLKDVDIKELREKFRQEVELKIQKIIINHYLGEKICPKCGFKNIGKYPSNIKSSVQYGDIVKSFASYLSSAQLIPYARLAKTFSDLFIINLSAGSLFNFNKLMADKSKPVLEDVKTNLQNSNVIHVDETGFKVENHRSWCFVFSNEFFTFLDFNKGRSYDALREIGILNDYNGNIITDFWPIYRKFENITNSFCNAHLLRELAFVSEIEKRTWADEISNILSTLNNMSKDKSSLYIIKRYLLIRKFDKIIKNALISEIPFLEKIPKPNRGRKKQTASKNLLDRLQKYKDGYLRFAFDNNIPFTNNQAERDFRFIKAQQKISGTFRTTEGAKNFLQISSLISTFKKQNIPVLEALKDMLQDKKIVFENG